MRKLYETIVSISAKHYILFSVVKILFMSAVLLYMGRELYCQCGYIKLWHGVVISSENSQHLFDWYTFTHILHGLGFFALLSLLGKRLPFHTKLLIAIFLESSWEVLENTDYVINRYREATIALDYYGDSVVNSLGDVLAMVVGFLFAQRFKIWMSVAVFILIELVLILIIKDSLLINIIMLIYPVEAIKLWQTS